MFRKFAKISLITIYLVIIAGAVVRMTGSGMGCPDWPKCFGYYIPPTEEEQLVWKPSHEYFKGQVIIVDESLKIAKSAFVSSDNYNTENWSNYEKHDYAVFNVWHTWIEYINRLLGALSGLFILIMFLLSLKYVKSKPSYTIWSFITLVLLLFQAWLGATVVYSNLLPSRITIHMIVALIIVALLLYIVHHSKENRRVYGVQKSYVFLVGFAIFLSLFQIGLGTQVRQFVDMAVKDFGYENKSMWLNEVDVKFYIHRSLSILVFLVNLGIWFLNRKRNYGLDKLTNALMGIIGLEIITGILMYYFDFPFLTQPLHLVIAAFMFSLQFYIFAKLFSKDKNEILIA
jgi:cytochrome c oxidase assembly protein subunit 15